MHIRRIDILHSPGVDAGFEIEPFADGLTIIEGRNESGKSTLAAAIRSLLWPGRHESLQARGEFEDAGRSYRSFVELYGGGWQGEAPRLPEANAGRGIIVGISDLWQADEHEAAVREAMTRELHGGYDLNPLRERAQRSSPTGPQAQLRQADRALTEARNAAKALMVEEARLPELRECAEQCRRAASKGELAEQALERLDVLEALQAAQHERDALPEGARRVRGDEGRRLDELRSAIEEAQLGIDREEGAARDAESSTQELGLPDAGIDQGSLTLLSQLESEALALAREVAEAQRQAERIHAEVKAVDIEPRAVEPAKLDAIDRALDEVQAARERRRLDQLAAEQWEEPSRPASSRMLAIATMLLAALAAIAAAVVSAWIAVGLAGLAAMLAAGALFGRPDSSEVARRTLQERADRSERNYREAVTRLSELAGDDGELHSTLSLVTAAKRAERQDKLVRDWHGARANAESLRAELDLVLERAATVLERHGQPPCKSADDLTRARATLVHLAGEHARYVELARQASDRAAEHRARRARAEQAYDAFLQGLGLAEDRLDELQDWLRLRGRAQALEDQIRKSEALLARHEGALASCADLLQMDRAALQAERARARQASEQADLVQRDIGGIERAIQGARRGADVNRALGEYEQAARMVAQARDIECAKAARRLILQEATAGVQHDELPALLHLADGLMSSFTEGAYGLVIDPAGQPAVRDLRAGAVTAYEQLSTGTRAQALLAMRLAGALEAERRSGASPLPLVLDEPLATTDDRRFAAVASALFELARRGRQLVYLTCEPSHAERLARMAESCEVSCTRHDLGAIRDGRSLARNPRSVIVEPKPAPRPEAVSREAYLAWRGVQPLDTWKDTDAIDLYHLMPDDLRLLHELGLQGLTSVGQVLAAHKRQGDGFAHLPVVRAAETAARLVRGWRQGRARPVTTADLVASGAVSEKFLQGIAELNAELSGSAGELLEIMEARSDERVKGFKSHKLGALREHFEACGLLPTGEPAERARLIEQALEGQDMCNGHQKKVPLQELASRLLDQLEEAERHSRVRDDVAGVGSEA